MNTIKVAIGVNKFDKTPKDLNLTTKELETLLTTFPKDISDKGMGRYLVSGHFEGQERITKNLKQKTLLTLDVDYYEKDLKSLRDDLRANLPNNGYFCYSSSSHTPEKPRIRIIIILSREVKPNEFRTISKAFLESLGDFAKNIETTSSCMPNNAMFLPIVTSADYQPWSEVIPGDHLDVDKFLVKGQDNTKPCNLLKTIKRLSISDDDVESYLKLLSVGELDHNQWLTVGMALHHQYEGSPIGQKIWTSWSLLDNRYKEDKIFEDCKYKWSTFSQDNEMSVTFHSVVSMVKDALGAKKNRDTPASIIKKQDVATNKKELIDDLVPNAQWFHVKGEHLTPVMCIENLEVLLSHYKINVTYNVISKDEEVHFDDKEQQNLNAALARIKSLCIRNRLPHALVQEYIQAIVQHNRVNPWKAWIESKAWDGVDRFKAFCDTVQVKPDLEDLKQIYFRSWLLQMIHMTCLNDSDTYKMGRSILVFQGAQKIGKTTWFNNLVPEHKSRFIQSGVTLNVGNQMSMLSCIRNAIVELGELDSTFRKSDMENLKNFISATKDVIDIKYQAYHMKTRRRTVFFASVNESKFLQDKTGNSRFMVLPVITCNAFHSIDHQQLYAQMLVLAKKDDNYELSEAECNMQTISNEEFESISVLYEKFEEVYNLDEKDSSRYSLKTATHVLEDLGFQVHNMKHHQNEIAKMLDKLGYERGRKKGRRGWMLPNLSEVQDIF